MPVLGILQECHWINQTILLQRTTRRARVHGCHDVRGRWDAVGPTLATVFSEQDLALCTDDPDHVGLLERCIEAGLVCRLPGQETFCKLPCRDIEDALERMVRRSSAPVHLRFLHNCLLTDGITISLKGTRTVMVGLSHKLGLCSPAPDTYYQGAGENKRSFYSYPPFRAAEVVGQSL